MPAENEGGWDRIEVSSGNADLPRALPPEASFKILGNETRLTILDTLWKREESNVMPFADLRKAVGVRDGSRFNYHLGKLLEGGFIDKLDGEYALRHAGAEVVWAIRRGFLTDHPEIDPFETTGRCVGCDVPLRARYADDMFFVDCHACDRPYSLGWFPPNALAGRTPEEALLVYERVGKANSRLAAAGICPKCNGPMQRTLAREWSDVPVRSEYLDPEYDGMLAAWHVCRNCGVWARVRPGESAMDHPAVLARYRERGIDVRTRPRWELPWLFDESAIEVVSETPFRVRQTVPFEDEELVLDLDEAFDVVSVE